ncbi:MAG: hypothetical protein KDA78_06580 [Planctomycetaceae bacterium]|nr:hypothetical protein [Planctomycetaceae bacterium]
MNRPVPGLIDVEGVEHLYVQVARSEGFRQFVDDAMSSCAEVPLPQSGGVVESKAHIPLADGSSLLALAYRGDIPGWRRKLTAYCESKGRKWGVASKQIISLSDGSEIDLLNTRITFEE